MGYVFHKLFENEYIRLTGIVAIDGAYLDLALGLAVAHVTGTSVDISNNDIFGDDTRKKVEVLQNAKGLAAEVYEALRLMKGILADRNYAIHGFASLNSNNNAVTHMRSRAPKGHKPGPHTNRDAAWFNNLIERMATVTAALIDHVIPAQPT